MVILALVGVFFVIALMSPSRTTRSNAPAATGPAPNAQRDVTISATCRGVLGQAVWNITLENTGTSSYRDLLYRSMYQAQSGTRLKTNRGTLNVRLAPGQKMTLPPFNDGPMPQQATACGMVIYGSNSELGGPQ